MIRIAVPLLMILITVIPGCASSSRFDATQRIEFNPAMVFPADQSLNRPEDGIALDDGQLLVTDRACGLRLVQSDGTSVPFGDLPGAGYRVDPPRHVSLANGMSLEPAGRHVLVADVLGGGIYRVALDDGSTDLVYQHDFGVNSVRRDTTGAIWFTQSTECTASSGEERLFAAVDVAMADGSVWRLDCRDGQLAEDATLMASGIHFANGIVLDEKRSMIYVSECMGDRVLKARLDVGRGTIGPMSTLITIQSPDNLELDGHGRLWVASPIRSEVGFVDLQSGTYHVVFGQQSSAQAAMSEDFKARGREQAPRLELLSPPLWEPLPGMVTGLILGPDDELMCITGLGNAMIRVDRE